MTSRNATVHETDRPTRDEEPDPSAAPGPARRRLPRFDLSATQLIATALAATTATFLASYLGVSGTIIGAAVASVATAIGNAVYGQSLRTTRDRVREVVPALRTDPASPTIVLPSRHVRPEPEPPTLPASGPAAEPVTEVARAWRRVGLVAAAIFVVVLAIVTGVEALAGRPVTDLVRGDSGTGTTLFGNTARTVTVTPSVPTVTVTVTPKIVVTTPTVTRTAPAVTATPTTPTPRTTPPTTPPGTGTPSTAPPSQTGGPSTPG